MRYAHARPQVVLLGRLGPGEQAKAESHLAVIDALHEQALEDVITLSQHGENVGDLKSQYDALWERAHSLRAELADLNESATPDWHTRADQIQQASQELLFRTAARRKQAPERKMLLGLSWGVGSAIVVAATAYYVWRRRRRKT
jgi:hypothetical protein